MVGAIVLAAGESTRMGTQKLLLPFGGVTVIEHIVNRLLATALEGVLVVTGKDREGVSQALHSRPVLIAHNADYRDGMLSSVRAGLRATPENWSAILVALGDHPSVDPHLVDDLIQEFSKREKGIIVPAHKGRRGHPLLFASQYRDEILENYDSVGLRGLFQAHADDIAVLETGSPLVLSDMDYPEDYQRELAALVARDERNPDSPPQ
jgi:molybdenum cofactor cytidylyltransferase